MGPKEKYYGSISLDGIKKAVLSLPDKVKENEKYGKQLYITAAKWDDGGISMEIWSKETGSIKLGNLRVSTFDNAASTSAPADSFKAQDDDLPF